MKLKRNLILLIVLISVSFKSFSQTDTKVLLTEPVARLVVKDLVTFDGLKLQYDLTLQRLQTLEEKTLTLQEVINNLQLQLDNRSNVIEQKNAQIENYEIISEDLKKALKRERATKKLYKIGSAIGVSALLLNMLK
jgi:hypothetical protein